MLKDMNRRILAIDIGGSSVKACQAIVRDSAMSWDSISTHPLTTASIDALRQLVSKIAETHREFDAVGISTAGTVDLNGQVIRAGAFDGYEMFSWRDEFAHMGLNLPVAVLNDGQAATLAEFDARAERRRQNTVHFVVGTGVGGGAVVDGKLLRGETGYAGALGHIKIISGPEALECGCRGHGCVQTVASARAVVAAYNALWKRRRRFIRRGHHSDPLSSISSLDDREIIALRAAMAEGGRWLGRAIGSAINAFNPGLVTIGGGLIEADKALSQDDGGFGPYTSAAFAEAKRSSLGASGKVASLTTGVLGNEAGIRGASLAALKLIQI